MDVARLLLFDCLSAEAVYSEEYLHRAGKTLVLVPFDTENLFLSPGPTAKFSLGSRKSSLYNWTPPNTPSFREKYYLSVLQQRKNQGDEEQGPCILSYLADCDFEMRLGNENHSSTEPDSFSSKDQKGTETRNVTPASDHRTLPLVLVQDTCVEGRRRRSPTHTTLDILKETPSLDVAPNSLSNSLDLGKEGRDSVSQQWSHQSVEQENVLSVGQKTLNAENDIKPAGSTEALEKLLQEVLDLLKSQNPGQTQLEELEYQLLCIRDKLKLKTSHQKHSSMESLMVEMVMESFDFLNMDCSADELSLFGSVRTDSISNSTYNGNTVGYDIKTETKELTTGNDDLDKVLIAHLLLCKALLQKLVLPNVAGIIRERLLEEVLRQKRVLEAVSKLSVLEAGSITSVEEMLRRLLEQMVTCSGLLPCPSPPAELLTLFQFHSYLEKEHVTNLEKHLAELTKEVMLIEALQRPGRLKKLKKLKGKRLNQLRPLPQTLRLLGRLQLDDNRHVGKAARSCLSRAAMDKNFREKALLFYTDILDEHDAKIQQAACLALKNLKAVESIDQIASLCQSETEEVRNAARETTLSFGKCLLQLYIKMLKEERQMSHQENKIGFRFYQHLLQQKNMQKAELTEREMFHDIRCQNTALILKLGEKGRLAFEKMDRVCCELREATYPEADIEITIF